MSLDKATVARIAVLARIDVPEAQQERLAGELSQIIGWIEQLAGDRPGDILRNAPKPHDGYFVVPKVVE